MPWSPTKVTRSAPKGAAALRGCDENVFTSDVLPAIGVEIVLVEADHAERRAGGVATRQTADRREPWSRTRAMTCHRASLPCRSEPRAATMPRSRASCDNSQTAPTEGPWTNSSALSAAAATIRLALRHKADLAGMVAAAAERALE